MKNIAKEGIKEGHGSRRRKCGSNFRGK